MGGMTHAQRTALIATALGQTSADHVFTGGRLVNVYSGEIEPDRWVAFKADRIAYVGGPNPVLIGDATLVHDLDGRFLLPGFIDGHTHLDSICTVGEYARYALAYGNTTAVSEVAMIANAMGERGVGWFMEELDTVPMKVFVLAPPLVPPFPELESSRPLSESYFRSLLASDRCLGVGETYWPAVIEGRERVLAQYEWAERAGKTCEGHAAGARGAKLMAYAAAGTTSCHEATTLDEALERFAARHGGHDTGGLRAPRARGGFGHREGARGARSGDDGDRYRRSPGTRHRGRHEPAPGKGGGARVRPGHRGSDGDDQPGPVFRAEGHRGARPRKVRGHGGGGRSHARFRCLQVWAAGRCVAEDGVPCIDPEPFRYPREASDSVAICPMGPEMFRVPVDGQGATVRVVEIVNETVTRESMHRMESRDGALRADPERDLLKAAVCHKSTASPHPRPCFGQGDRDTRRGGGHEPHLGYQQRVRGRHVRRGHGRGGEPARRARRGHGGGQGGGARGPSLRFPSAGSCPRARCLKSSMPCTGWRMHSGCWARGSPGPCSRSRRFPSRDSRT